MFDGWINMSRKRWEIRIARKWHRVRHKQNTWRLNNHSRVIVSIPKCFWILGRTRGTPLIVPSCAMGWNPEDRVRWEWQQTHDPSTSWRGCCCPGLAEEDTGWTLFFLLGEEIFDYRCLKWIEENSVKIETMCEQKQSWCIVNVNYVNFMFCWRGEYWRKYANIPASV